MNEVTRQDEIPELLIANSPTDRQQLFVRYVMAVLIDLTVLNLCAEYWDHVSIDTFTTSLFAAILLQILLKLTLMVEHQVALFFKGKSGGLNRFLRFFCAWLVLFGSKFVILYAIDFTFGEKVLFTGPVHGLVAFIAVVAAVLAAEEIVSRIYRRLG